MKKLISICLSLFILVGLVMPVTADCIKNNLNSVTANVKEAPVNDFYSEISDTEFTGDGVIYVIMHHDISDVGKIYTAEDFPELDVESIEDITSVNINDTKEDYGSNFRNVLKITLRNNENSNVINAIQKLQERADKDIYWAEPAYYFDIAEFEENSAIDAENLTFDLMDYWKSVIKYMDETENNVVDYIESKITDFPKRDPIKVAIVEEGGVGTHDDFTITVQEEDGTFSNVSILEPEVDIRESNVDPIVRGHATTCARFITASSAISNKQTISLTSFILGDPNVLNDHNYDAGDLISKIVGYLNDYEIEIASMSFSKSCGVFHNEVTATSIINNYKGLIIASAGNEGKDVDNNDNIMDKPLPAALESDNIIAVGASNESDTMWAGSNYGNYSGDLFAPGERIIHYTADKNNDGIDENYYISGTSASTPIVSGTAALMKYVNPNLSNLQIKAILLNTVDRNDAFIGKCVSGGRLNAYEAVRLAYEIGQENPDLTQEELNRANLLFHASSGTVIDYVGTQSYAELPETLCGVNITTVRNIFSNDNTVETVNIKLQITEVPEYAFANCSKLKKVILPGSVQTIGYKAFFLCENLKELMIPPSVTSIAAPAFDSSDLLYVSYNGYAYDHAVENNMAYCAISGSSVSEYSSGNYSSYLREIDIPETFYGTVINEIGNCAFEGGTDIENVNMSFNIRTIGYSAFKNCSALKSITLPSSIQSISNNNGASILEGCSYATVYCEKSTLAWIYAQSNNITCIEMSVFTNGNDLTYISVTGIVEAEGRTTEYFIPESYAFYTVSAINSNAFYTDFLNPLNMTVIHVPESVKSIGDSAFSTCANLTDIYINSAETTVGANCFYPLNKQNLTVHCYMGSPAFLYAIANGYTVELM